MKTITYLLLLVSVVSCSFPVEEKIIDNYYLVSSPNNNQVISVSYYLKQYDSFVGVVGPGVKYAEHDERFIFIKMGKKFSQDIPLGKFEYFIVPICYECDNYLNLDKYFGPFDRVEFDSACDKLNVDKKINFD